MTELEALGERLARTLGRDDLQYGIALDALADIYEDLGDAPHCLETLRKGLHAFTAAVGPEHQYVKITESNLAVQLVNTGHHAEALQLVDAIAPWFAVHAGRHSQWRLVESRTGALIGLGQPAEALAVLEAIPAAECSSAGDLRWKVDGLRGRALVALGRRAEGVTVLTSAVESGAKSGDDHALGALRRALESARQ